MQDALLKKLNIAIVAHSLLLYCKCEIILTLWSIRDLTQSFLPGLKHLALIPKEVLLIFYVIFKMTSNIVLILMAPVTDSRINSNLGPTVSQHQTPRTFFAEFAERFTYFFITLKKILEVED